MGDLIQDLRFELHQRKASGEIHMPMLLETAITRLAALEQQAKDAESIAQEWCHSAGWATGHGDTLADILREMRSQHCDERSMGDLVASGGLPEAQALSGCGAGGEGDGGG